MAVRNLERLHASVRADVEAYCRRLVAALGTSIKSISVYGSATGPDYIPTKSNVNIVVVLETLGAESLTRTLDVVDMGRKRKIVPPLLVTQEYVRSSLDVFPIEYLEIKDSQVVIYGDDFFSGIEVGRDYLRLECESQLRAAVLRTRQAYLELGKKKRGPEQVLHTSVTSLIPVFRAMLRLKGTEVPRRKIEAVEAVEKVFGFDTKTFAAILRDKAGDERIDGKDAHRVLAEYIDAVEGLAGRLDQL